MGNNQSDLIKPDYQVGSIVNLMSSILHAFGGRSQYKPLKNISPDELGASRNVVLMMLDGLGYEFLQKIGREGIFQKHLRGKITSVFPATTATAVTTFATGVAPQQHAITGWFMYLKEIGTVTKILPFTTRAGGKPIAQGMVDPKIVFDVNSIYNQIERDTYIVIDKIFVDSAYNIATAGQAQRVGCSNLEDFLNQIKQLVTEKNKKYIYAYWPKLDSLSHEYGIASKKSLRHFKELENEITAFIESIKNTSTTIVITADHGFIDSDDMHTIDIEYHPDFVDMLTLPLCGEPRVAYCYVRPSQAKAFEQYVRENFQDECDLYKAEDLVVQDYYGLNKPHRKLYERIGDYVLIMMENYVMKQIIEGERIHNLIGYHGGMTKHEMYVPLIVVKA